MKTHYKVDENKRPKVRPSIKTEIRVNALALQLERLGYKVPARCRLNLSTMRDWRRMAMLAAVMCVVLCRGDTVTATNVAAQIKANQAEMDAVAWCLYVEARGEGSEGLIAVAGVIKTRAYLKGLSFRDTVFKHAWFSGVGESIPAWFLAGEIDAKAGRVARGECYKVAKSLVLGEGKFPSFTHYYAHRLGAPYWAGKLSDVTVVGNHTFGYYRYF